ncbi:hypothetical protein ABZ478_20185 [Streptomyces sp. NPDC005706]|uniref:hypothetical protein n=1 Tax=Streptomyces sp. NPDC005706 TaxID=3157169 RepID=UPI0033ED2AB2
MDKDALFMMISDLNNSDSTFVVVQPDEDDHVWFGSVAVLAEGGYEIVESNLQRPGLDATRFGGRRRPRQARGLRPLLPTA